MLFSVRLRLQLCKVLRKNLESKTYFSRQAGFIYPNPEDEYSKVPQYPPVEKPKSEEEKETQAWYDKIKRQKTVEEKLFEINIPRYWGWKCLLMKEGNVPYNGIDFIKFITRTHLVESEELPTFYKDSSSKCFYLAEGISKDIQNLVVDNDLKKMPEHNMEDSDELSIARAQTKVIVNELNRLILRALASEYPSLQSIQIDYSPRMEAFWKLGSLKETYVPEEYPFGMKKEEIPEEYLGRPSDKYIQYIGRPIIQLRSENPLPPLLSLNESLYLQYPVPIYQYDPFVVFGCEMVRRHVTNIPGFWPGEPREYSFLSYHDTNYLTFRPDSYGPDDMKETLQCQAILSSFAWLMSLSSYQGFTTFHDVTYPFVTQTVLTDGRNFSFAVYQLSTTELYHESPIYNPKCNICWITPCMPLYEVVDKQIRGINTKVVKLLMQFYTRKTEALEACNRKPYLDKTVALIANYEDEEKRCWLEKRFKHFSSNQPRGRIDKMYELHDYERIFKVQYSELIRDPRTRPFELRQNPYLRKMSDNAGEYIPRSIRPDADLPKYKQKKFRNTYYPQ